jgi:hypothetical protein
LTAYSQRKRCQDAITKITANRRCGFADWNPPALALRGEVLKGERRIILTPSRVYGNIVLMLNLFGIARRLAGSGQLLTEANGSGCGTMAESVLLT